ncbi:MAG: zinc ribbon domain-containing protein [Anaerolineales bacterium]|nr:zinc ribbon domain-containing protein [Anaerolineales bacterium]
MKCPDCGQEVHPEAKFCGFCGQRLNGLAMADSAEDPIGKSSVGMDAWGSTREDAATMLEGPSGEHEEARSEAGFLNVEGELKSKADAKKRWPVWLWIVLAIVSVLGLLTATGVLEDLFNPQAAHIPENDVYELDLMPFADVSRLAYGIPVTLNGGWITVEEAQAEDFLDAIGKMEIRLNGVELQNVMSGWQGIEWVYYAAEEDEYPAAIFRYNLGILDPGTYLVDTTLELSRDHDDGFDIYPAGMLWDWEMEFEILDK